MLLTMKKHSSDFCTLLLCLAFIGLVSCRKQTVDPIPPLGTSYLTAEVNGKKNTYVEGDNDIELSGRFNFSVLHPNPGHGAGFRNLTDGSDWSIYFFFTPEEYQKNTGNFPKLFDAGKFDFIKLDKNYQYTNIRGVEIIKSQKNENGDQWRSTSYQQNERPQLFEVTKAYFYGQTYDRFIWVEGTFDCWVGNFYETEHIKGKFRIKVQHDLQ